MIGTFRRFRQKLNSILSGWMPAQEVTLLSLRPMPWELDGKGRPSKAFQQHMAALAAAGWHADSALLPALPRGKAECLSLSGTLALKPFRRLTLATQIASFEEDGIRLGHLICSGEGMVAGSMVTRLAFAPSLSPRGEREKGLRSAVELPHEPLGATRLA